MHPGYYDYEELAMLNGIEPQNARFRMRSRALVQLGQVPAETFFPTLDIPTEGEAAQQAEPPVAMGTTPGSVPVRPERWDFDTQPLATYRLAPGDTFVGLARTYLHPSGVDWREISHVQTPEMQARQGFPDLIFAEEIIRMPKRATDNMKAFLALGEPGGQKPSELTKSQKTTAKASKFGKYALIGGGAGLAAYFLYKAFV